MKATNTATRGHWCCGDGRLRRPHWPSPLVLGALLVALAASQLAAPVFAACATTRSLGDSNYALTYVSEETYDVTTTNPTKLFDRACFKLSRAAACTVGSSPCCTSVAQAVKSIAVTVGAACVGSWQKAAALKTGWWSIGADRTKHAAAVLYTTSTPPQWVVTPPVDLAWDAAGEVELCVNLPAGITSNVCQNVAQMCGGFGCAVRVTSSTCCLDGSVPAGPCTECIVPECHVAACDVATGGCTFSVAPVNTSCAGGQGRCAGVLCNGQDGKAIDPYPGGVVAPWSIDFVELLPRVASLVAFNGPMPSNPSITVRDYYLQAIKNGTLLIVPEARVLNVAAASPSGVRVATRLIVKCGDCTGTRAAALSRYKTRLNSAMAQMLQGFKLRATPPFQGIVLEGLPSSAAALQPAAPVQSAEAQPIIATQSAEAQPIIDPQSAEARPITDPQSAEAQPIVDPQSAAEAQPIIDLQSAEAQPIVDPQSAESADVLTSTAPEADGAVSSAGAHRRLLQVQDGVVQTCPDNTGYVCSADGCGKLQGQVIYGACCGDAPGCRSVGSPPNGCGGGMTSTYVPAGLKALMRSGGVPADVVDAMYTQCMEPCCNSHDYCYSTPTAADTRGACDTTLGSCHEACCWSFLIGDDLTTTKRRTNCISVAKQAYSMYSSFGSGFYRDAVQETMDRIQSSKCSGVPAGVQPVDGKCPCTDTLECPTDRCCGQISASMDAGGATFSATPYSGYCDAQAASSDFCLCEFKGGARCGPSSTHCCYGPPTTTEEQRELCCGADLCCKPGQGETCCGVAAGRPTCCTQGQECVGSACCTTPCGPTGARICCGAGQECINGNTCCAKPCGPAGAATCCGSGKECIGNTCCPQAQICGTTCCGSTAICVASKCCPKARACGSVCCPYGQVCVGGSCCPATAACGTPTPTACCKAPYVCGSDGQCVCPDYPLVCHDVCCSWDEACRMKPDGKGICCKLAGGDSCPCSDSHGDLWCLSSNECCAGIVLDAVGNELPASGRCERGSSTLYLNPYTFEVNPDVNLACHCKYQGHELCGDPAISRAICCNIVGGSQCCSYGPGVAASSSCTVPGQDGAASCCGNGLCRTGGCAFPGVPGVADHVCCSSDHFHCQINGYHVCCPNGSKCVGGVYACSW